MKWVRCVGVVGLLAVPACKPLMVTTEDVVVMPGQPAALTAYTEKNIFWGVRAHKRGIPVTFYVDEQEVGRSLSDANARASVEPVRLADDTSSFAVSMGEGTQGPKVSGRIFRFHPDRTIIAVDIDECLMDTKYSSAIFYHQDHVSQPFPHASDAMRELARECDLFYISARPRYYYDQTVEWLKRYNFPVAPVLLSPRTRAVLHQTANKRDRIAQLRQHWPNLVIGIGDNKTDTGGFAPNGLLTIIVRPRPRSNCGHDAAFFPDWASALRFIHLNHDILVNPRRVEAAMRGELALRLPLASGEPATNVALVHHSSDENNHGQPAWCIVPVSADSPAVAHLFTP